MSIDPIRAKRENPAEGLRSGDTKAPGNRLHGGSNNGIRLPDI